MERVAAVRRYFLFASSNDFNAVLTHKRPTRWHLTFKLKICFFCVRAKSTKSSCWRWLIVRTRTKFEAPEQPQPLTPVEASALPSLSFQAWQEKDLTAIPSPTFVYSDFYALGYTSLTVAPPKVGKSMLALAEAIDIATGQGILTGYTREPLRVLYYNAEDDQDVLDARVFIQEHTQK